MFSPTVYRITRSRVAVSLAAVFLSVLLPVMANAQEAYLVTAQGGSLSAYNLATNSLIETTTAGLGKGNIAVGPNPRLAFISAGSYISIIDLAIQREIQQSLGVFVGAGPLIFTPDGQYLLGYDYTANDPPNNPEALDVFDAASMQLLHQIPLDAALGTAALGGPVGSIVVVGHKAYIAPQNPDATTPTMAVVDLNTFQVTAIPIPAGNFGAPVLATYPPNAAATPDGQYVVVVETENSDGGYHLLFISTATDALAMDNATTFDPYGIVIPPATDPAYGYLVGFDSEVGFVAIVLDLNPGSPTFGQLLTQTEVNLSPYFSYESGLAVNSSGSRLVVSGFLAGISPQANVIVIDTGQMLNNPNQAIVATTVAADGAQTIGLTIATIATTMPPLAPAVRSVSGRTVNNAPITLHIFGSNFQPGAMVRVGGMTPIASTVNSPRDLEITLPVNAPAGPSQDVLVTNPNLSGPPSRQYLSGVLPGGVNIQTNPAFSTPYQFASVNTEDGSVSIYDPSQRAMVNVSLSPPAYTPASCAFNAGGTDFYTGSLGYRHERRPYLLDLNVANHAEATILTAGNRIYGYQSMAASVNPATGNSVMYEWTGYQDIIVSMVDADPLSPTFNTVIKTLHGNLGTDVYIPFAGAATPDGKYVYLYVEDEDPSGNITTYIDIFDVVHGGNPTVILVSSLGVADPQRDMVVSSDGKSLLFTFTDSNGNGGIKVFDIGVNPLNPTPVTTIVPDDDPYLSGLYSYTVIGNRLFAYDYVDGPVANPIWIYNFDRQHNNFSLLGSAIDNYYGAGNKVIAVSPDGNLLFVPIEDGISIFDVSHIVDGQAPLITNLAASNGPAVMAVSPVPGQNLIKPYTRGLRRHDAPRQVEEEKPVDEAQSPQVERHPEQIQFHTRNPRLTLEP